MKSTTLALAALAIGGLVSTAAVAAPLTPAAGASPGVSERLAVNDIQQVQKRSYRKYRRGYHRHYRRHRHYHGPAGWTRYSYRPYNWSTRGCVVVGPVWFCP
ncbi:MAG: hypothetical protein NW216_01465 [Hyphomicrobium sp.]|nr:hypothetical protein [Hyphomicrobium sp.]